MQGWQVWIDTGGTFTDCLALGPHGQWRRVKVLSSGSLRGELTGRIGPGCYGLSQRWPTSTDIFAGYSLRLLGASQALANVVQVDLAAGRLYTDTDLALPTLPLAFELGAGEEAPVLAARLATDTPLNQPLPPLELRLGTTKGTNALLERKGKDVCLLITRGLADLLYIGTQQRPHLFQLAIPEPGLLPAQVIEVNERLDATGQVCLPLTAAEIERVLAEVRAPSVAIALLHSYRNPVHEQRLADALAQAGYPYVSVSHLLSPSVKLLPRAQTALVNAYLDPLIQRYLQRIQTKLGPPAGGGFLVMGSSGGLAPASHFLAKDSLLSGPAGGMVGAARVAESLGYRRILTLDMGGTSTDTARYDGAFDYRFYSEIDGVQLLAPALAIETVAAGGGSVCGLHHHQLTVGPASAGADPGPACYGAGGPLTLTDVNLLLGKLDPAAMSIPIDRAAAEAALAQIQQTLQENTGRHYPADLLLRGYEQIADEKMAEAIRRISVARGFDPRAYALLAFGGAGGLHACAVAERLGIHTVILPADAGLLSAYGMGQARVERMAQRQVLRPWHECDAVLPQWIQALGEAAAAQLQQEGFDTIEAQPTRCLLFMRFAGQETSLELEYQAGMEVAAAFEAHYQLLFGHYPAGQTLELESIKVLVATAPPPPLELVPPPAAFAATPARRQAHTAIYLAPALQPGATLSGPATVLYEHATAYVPPHWTLAVQAHGHAILQRQATPIGSPADHAYGEAVDLALFSNRFGAIAAEMGAQLQRTAFSVNVKERLDFSCALLDAHAQLLVNAPHIPVHLGSLGVCARLTLARQPLGPGDVAIVNHPKYGGSHLPDITLLAGVFTDANELIGYVINRAHHAEIGGKRPGSMPPDAANLAEEGVVFAPGLLVQAGQVQWEAIRAKLTAAPWPSRSPNENLADLNAGLAALRSGAAALRQLTTTHGLAKVHHFMEALQADAHQRLNHALVAYAGQTLQATEALDDGSRICVSIEVNPPQLTFNFSGTADCHPGNLNANVSIVNSALIYVLRLLCQADIPLNEGLLRGVRLHLPPNSLLHPLFHDNPELCPAVVGGNTEVSQRLVDTLLKAFGLAAASQGTMNNLLFGNDHFGYYETIGGGAGAGPGFPGRSGIHQHMTNTRITDPEELERRYPVRLWHFGLRHGSGGPGAYRGGNGLVRTLEALAPLSATLLTQRRSLGPYGMAGGSAGQPGRQYVQRVGGNMEALPGIATVDLHVGDQLTVETPGGGGWGPPA